jgi:hypothetical protein
MDDKAASHLSFFFAPSDLSGEPVPVCFVPVLLSELLPTLPTPLPPDRVPFVGCFLSAIVCLLVCYCTRNARFVVSIRVQMTITGHVRIGCMGPKDPTLGNASATSTPPGVNNARSTERGSDVSAVDSPSTVMSSEGRATERSDTTGHQVSEQEVGTGADGAMID